MQALKRNFSEAIPELPCENGDGIFCRYTEFGMFCIVGVRSVSPNSGGNTV